MNPTLPLTVDESLILRLLREAGVPPGLTAPPLPPDPAPAPPWAAGPAPTAREGFAGWVATGLGLALLVALVLRPTAAPPALTVSAATLPATATSTATRVPPTATAPPTATWTPVPPTATTIPPTATARPVLVPASTGGSSGNTNHPAPVRTPRPAPTPAPAVPPPGGGMEPARITPVVERPAQSRPPVPVPTEARAGGSGPAGNDFSTAIFERSATIGGTP